MSPHEKALAQSLAEQLAHEFTCRGLFAGARVRRASVHVRPGPPVPHRQLPTQPPGVVLELVEPAHAEQIAYVHIEARDGRLRLRNALLSRIDGRWQLGPTWTDRFVLPAQALVAVHFGRALPTTFVQQVADLY